MLGSKATASGTPTCSGTNVSILLYTSYLYVSLRPNNYHVLLFIRGFGARGRGEGGCTLGRSDASATIVNRDCGGSK